MTLRPQAKHLLLLAALASQTLTFSDYTRAQAAPAAQTERGGPTAPQTSAEPKMGSWDNPEQRRIEYRSFLQLMDSDAQKRRQLADAGDGQCSSCVDWAKLFGIREDEWQSMRSTVADAYRLIQKIDDGGRTRGMELRQHPNPEESKKFSEHGKVAANERTRILDEAIAKLALELGDEDFKRVDDWVYRNSSPKWLQQPRAPNSLSLTASASSGLPIIFNAATPSVCSAIPRP